MIHFFIKHKKARGVITIFLTIIYLAAYMFAGVFVDGARVKMAQTVIEDVQQISNENVMAQYDRGLYEYYGLMATCGYDPDAIAKEVQEEINAAIGLRFDVDEVKSFITNCFINASNGYKVASWSDANTEEVKSFNTFFKPYQLDVKVASVSTIDLTDSDVLRAQIRDEMRYKFPVILGASFFDELEQFLTLGGAANEIRSIIDEISEENDSLLYKQSVYYENVNKFYEEYYDFIKKLYGNDRKINSNNADIIIEGLTNVINSIKDVIKNISSIFVNLAQFITGINFTKKWRNYENNKKRKDIYEGIKEITDNSNENNFVLNKYSDEYNAQEWPQADDYGYICNEEDSDDEDYEPEYALDEVEFKNAINNEARVRQNKFENKVNEFKIIINNLLKSNVESSYVKNIEIPCLSEFVGFGKNLLEDSIKAKVGVVLEVVSFFKKDSNIKNKFCKFLALPDNIKAVANNFQKSIKDFNKKIHVTGIIAEEETIGIEAMFPSVSLELGGIQDLISAHDDYMKAIEKKLEDFAKKYDEYSGDDFNQKVADVYASYLETFLISWAELRCDGEVYKNIEKLIKEIDSEFDESSNVTDDFTTRICENSLDDVYSYVFTLNDEDSDKDEMDHLEELLKNRQNVIVEKIKKHVEDINKDGLENLKNFNDLDSLQLSLVRLFSAVFNIMSANRMELFKHTSEEKYEYIDRMQGSRGGSSSTVTYIDPWGHIEPYDKSIESTDAPNDLNEDSFDIVRVTETVKKILSVPIEIVERVPKEFTNDMNDVSYILSHFRDYAHTYRAKEIGIIGTDGSKRSEEYDNILNARFIKNQSKTEYLDNAQFENLEVTPAEIEYILFGHEGDNSNVNNVVQMYTTLFLLRTAVNYISVFFSPNALKSVESISSALGPFAPLGVILAPLIYALPQSVIETKNIMYDCKKEELFNTGFGLYDPYKNAIFGEINISDIQERAKEVLKQTKDKIKKGFFKYVGNEIKSLIRDDNILRNEKIDGIDFNTISEFEMPTVLLVLNNIEDIKNTYEDEEFPQGVEEAKEQLSKWLLKKVKNYGTNILFDEEDREIVNKDNAEESKILKTGYSTYVTLLLFLFGCTPDGKKEQMIRVQNVIDTNMKKVYENNGMKEDNTFALKNAYARVAVETECSINYIFMTNSFMPTNIKFGDDARFKLKIKTASAY